MDLSQINAFLAVAENGSFTKAARSLNLSQPSVSIKVIALEKHLKSTLINRENNTISLSETGKYAQAKLIKVVKEIEELENYFRHQEQLSKNTFTIYHESDLCMGALSQLIVHIKLILGEEAVVNTLQCKDDQQIIELLKQHANAFGLSKTKTDIDGIESRLLTDEEFMLLCPENYSTNNNAVDLCSLLSEKILLPELQSESMRLFKERIKPFGLEISDFTRRSHVSETLMPELVKHSDVVGIRLCNRKERANTNQIQINELTTPYGLYLLIKVKNLESGRIKMQEVYATNPNYQSKDKYPPTLPRKTKLYSKYILPREKAKDLGEKCIRIGIQNRTIQTVVSGRAVQKLGLLESFISTISNNSQNEYSTKWIDYKSAAPILSDLKETELDIAIIGDYAISHMATSQIDNPANSSILVSFVSINPYGSGSNLLIRKDAKETGLQSLKEKTIAVPFLSTAYGSLLYNLNRKKILNSTKLVNIDLESHPNLVNSSLDAGAVACFTPFDHFISAGQHYYKVEEEVSTPFAFYGVVVRKQFAIEQPEIVIAFLKAMICSNHWFYNTNSSIEHLSRWTGISKTYINYILGERHGKDGHYQPDMKIREDWIKEYTENIFIESQDNKLVSPNKEQFIETEFLQVAMKELGMPKL